MSIFKKCFLKLRVFRASKRAEVNKIIALVVVVILISALIPTAFHQLSTANTTGWSTSTKDLWSLVPIIAIIGIFLLVLKVAGVLGKR